MRTLVLGVSVPALVLGIAAGAVALPDGDRQIWSAQAVECGISDRWKIKVQEEFRVGEDAEQLYEQFTDLGTSCKATGWLTLGVNYRHVYKRSGTTWKMEKRPHFNVTVGWRLLGFNFKDRSRLERRAYDDREDEWRYRNRLAVSPPKTWGVLGVAPYVAGEAFVNLDETDVNRYRLYLGAARRLAGPLGVELYYMVQSTEAEDDWTDYHVVGMGWSARF